MVDSAKGNVREGFAKMTGNESEQAKGKQCFFFLCHVLQNVPNYSIVRFARIFGLG